MVIAYLFQHENDHGIHHGIHYLYLLCSIFVFTTLSNSIFYPFFSFGFEKNKTIGEGLLVWILMALETYTNNNKIMCLNALQGKYPLVKVFVEAPIKVVQKPIFSGVGWVDVLVDVFLTMGL